MKKLTLRVPTVFLMVGIPGAGKSFFARQFAADFGLPHISADRIRHELFNEPGHTHSEQAIVARMVDYMSNEIFNSQSSFIIDSQFANTRTARLSLDRRARIKGYQIIAIWVQVDKRSAKSRSLNRKNGKRDDLYNSSLPEKVFDILASQLAMPSTEPHVVISGRHTFATQKSAVLNRLQISNDMTVAAVNDNRGSATTQANTQSEPPSSVAARPKTSTIKVSDSPATNESVPDTPMKVITPTPTRTMDKPAKRGGANRKIIIS